jgi:hypothetical protein
VTVVSAKFVNLLEGTVQQVDKDSVLQKLELVLKLIRLPLLHLKLGML